MAALALTLLAQWALGTPSAALFVIGVIGCTAFFGLSVGLFTSAVAVLTLDYLFIPPLFHFNMDGWMLRVAGIFIAVTAGTHFIERRISARIRSHLRPPLGMHGSVDGLERGELYGWAMDADRPAEAVPITLLINKHPVAHVAAVYHRPDVAETMDCSGRHGFYIDLAPYFPTEQSAWIDVRLPNGVSVANAPQLMTVPAIAPRREKPTVIYMHIPKTAGTAFREAIAANFVQSEIAYMYPQEPGFLTTDLRALPLEQRRAFRVVIGHLQFGVHEMLPQRSDYVTIVREPTARILSQYAYLQQTQPWLLRDIDGREMSLPELMARRLTVDFDNTMVRCFSGVDEREYPPGSVTQEIFDDAVRNLNRHFTFVGHQEEAAEAYRSLAAYYNWEAIPELPTVNRGRSQRSVGPSAELLAAIRECNRWDYLLYQEALRLFPLTRGAGQKQDPAARHVEQA